MVFGIVQLVCRAVPGHDVAWVIAVPQQHATFERIEQTGAAVHLAVSKFVQKLVSKQQLTTTWSSRFIILKELGRARPGLVAVYFSCALGLEPISTHCIWTWYFLPPATILPVPK